MGGASAVRGGASTRRPSVTGATRPSKGSKGRCAPKHKCLRQDPGRFAKALRNATARPSNARASNIRPPGPWLDALEAGPLISSPSRRVEWLLDPEPPAGAEAGAGRAGRRHLLPCTAPLAAPSPAFARPRSGAGLPAPSAVLRAARLGLGPARWQGRAAAFYFVRGFCTGWSSEVGSYLGPRRRGPVNFFSFQNGSLQSRTSVRSVPGDAEREQAFQLLQLQVTQRAPGTGGQGPGTGDAGCRGMSPGAGSHCPAPASARQGPGSAIEKRALTYRVRWKRVAVKEKAFHALELKPVYPGSPDRDPGDWTLTAEY
ncbi:hypothetical protein H8959_009896 [Pygathrix nigripes]